MSLLQLRLVVRDLFKQSLMEAVRHLHPDHGKETEPLKDTDKVTVYHGFHYMRDALYAAKFGISGKERAPRVYSYETGNNPKGWFVTIDLDRIAKQFAHGGVIMEIQTSASNLEAPVWVGGRSYYVQGEFTKSFGSDEERETQRLANRDRDAAHQNPAVAKSDRPELAQTLFDNAERQALFVGELNPNMIKGFWVNEQVMFNNRDPRGEPFKFYSRRAFMNKFFDLKHLKQTVSRHDGWHEELPQKYYDLESKLFQPAEDFSWEKLKDRVLKGGWDYQAFKDLVTNKDKIDGLYYVRNFFHPKQLEQLKQRLAKGEEPIE